MPLGEQVAGLAAHRQPTRRTMTGWHWQVPSSQVPRTQAPRLAARNHRPLGCWLRVDCMRQGLARGAPRNEQCEGFRLVSRVGEKTDEPHGRCRQVVSTPGLLQLTGRTARRLSGRWVSCADRGEDPGARSTLGARLRRPVQSNLIGALLAAVEGLTRQGEAFLQMSTVPK